MLAQKNHVLTASIGIAIFPDDGEEEDKLLKHADTAMYQAKLYSRNTSRLFTEAMNEAVTERLAIEQGLRARPMEDRFAIFYQPIVDLTGERLEAYEALLRWKHPERGFVPPVSSLDVAEHSGLIIPLGKWVIQTACRQAVQQDAEMGAMPSVSVNISPRQFEDADLVPFIGEVIESTGIEASSLQLEISESMALSVDSVATTLGNLRELGVRIAIDGFGTSYAALSRLQELPVDIVKIDKSFVRAIKVGSVSEAIVTAIVNMARILDYYVVAEGVETAAELVVIRKTGSHAVQGYYLGKPMPPEKLNEALS